MESIIIFIIFAVISSLFNKDKKTQKNYRRSIKSEDSQSQTNTSETLEKTRPTQQKNLGSLGDLLKELKTDFDDLFKEKSPSRTQKENYKEFIEEEKDFYTIKQEDMTYEYQNEYQEYLDNIKEEEIIDKTDKRMFQTKSNNIQNSYDDETINTSYNFNLSFDQKNLIKGIIMSEILAKPKALRK